MKLKSTLRHLLAILGTATLAISSATAADGTWTPTAAGTFDWSLIATGNWSGGIVASGTDSTANFTADIGANQVVNLAEAITIGNITFNDASHNMTISGANILTLDRSGTDVPIIDVTTLNRTLFITSAIAGVDGFQKNGAGILDLKTATNTFTGDIVLNGGQLTISNTSNLGNTANDIVFTGNATLRTETSVVLGADRTITINDGVTATLTSTNDGDTFQGVLAGSGDLNAAHTTDFIFSNTANTFTGAIRSATGVSTSYGLTFASLSDEAGDGNISLDEGSFHWIGTGGTKTFDDRQFILSGGTGRDGVIVNKSSDNSALVITQDLAVTGAGTKFIQLAGTSLTTNTFAGDIDNGAADTLNLIYGVNSTALGNWAITGDLSHTGLTTVNGGNTAPANQETRGQLLLSGTNTNTGGYSVLRNGTLVFQGEQSLANGNAIELRHDGGTNASSRLRLLSDTAGTVTRDTVINLVTTNNTGSQNIFVGNNNTANLGTSNGTTTGSTIRVGELNFSTIAATAAAGGIIAQITGANDYRLQIDSVTLNNLANRAASTTTNMGFNPTTANVTIGNITQANGNVNNAVAILNLQGTSLDNRITGTISDAADFTDNSNSGAAALEVLKTNTAGVWTLSGNNTYTGSTTIAGGTLAIGGSGTLGHVSAGVGNYAGAIAIASTNSGKLVYNSSASQTLGGVISGAGALDVEAGILTLTNDNTYTGATNVNGGTLVVNGDQSLATGAVTIASGATLGGSGTLGGAVTVDGSIAPGNSIGTLNVASNVTWNAGNAWQFELGAGNDSDVLAITGDFDKGTGSSFVFDFLNSTDLGTFTLVTWTGTTDFLLSDFSHINYDGAMTGSFVLNANSLQFTAIPEPTTALAGLLLGLGLLRRRRA